VCFVDGKDDFRPFAMRRGSAPKPRADGSDNRNELFAGLRRRKNVLALPAGRVVVRCFVSESLRLLDKVENNVTEGKAIPHFSFTSFCVSNHRGIEVLPEIVD
jgi:hypothetical protein